MNKNSSLKPRSISLQRWMVLSLIPLAFLVGYVTAEDERIEQIEALEQQQAQLKADIKALRNLGIAIQKQCQGETNALVI
jgi:Tfp pilus assembly protein PilN